MRLSRFCFASLLLAGSMCLLTAQTAGGLGDPAAAPGSPASSYALNGLDHLNYYNGMINVAIPLVTIGGRGEASRAITIPIQRQWEVINTGGVYTPDSRQGQNLTGLYTSGYISTQSVSSDSYVCYLNDHWVAAGPYTTYIVWTSFDGTQTILKDALSNGQAQGAGVNSCGAISSYTPYNRGREFHSSDGTDLTFIADQDVVDQNVTSVVGGTLVTRDGLRLRFSSDGYVSQVEDRNGNLINNAWTSTPSGGIYTFTDPLARTTTVNYTQDLTSNTQDEIKYQGADGASRSITVNYAPLQSAATEPLQTSQCLFPELNGASSSTQFNPYVISNIVLADETQYTMRYNAYGELAQLTLPTGGYYTYTYSEAHCSINGNTSGVITLANNSGYRIWRPLRERDEYADGTHLSGKLMLGYPGENAADPNHTSRPVSLVMADFEDAGGNILRKEMHFFYGDPATTQPPPSDPTTFAPWWEGLEFQTYIADGNYTVRQAVEQVYQQRACTEGNCGFDPTAENAPSHDPQLCQTVTTFDNVASGVLYKYDEYNNVTDKWEYDYGAAPGIGSGCLATPPGNYLRHTQTQYVGGNYLGSNINLLSLPELVKVDGGGATISQTHYGYDELPLAPAPGIVGHDDAFGIGLIMRGNLTNPATCLNPASCTWMNHTRHYDIAGNMVTSVDAKNNTTQFGYNDDGQNKYAFVTSITNARGHKTSFLYDYGAGKPSWVIDPNNVATQFVYGDSLDRVTQVRRAAGGGSNLENKTNINYYSPNWTLVCTDQKTTDDCGYQTQTVYDGLGRVLQTRTIEDSSVFVGQDTAYDSLGRVSSVTNPYRTNYQIESNDGLAYTTATTYDILGRAVRVQTADGSATTSYYLGNQTMVTDPAGKQRRYTYDAAGRLSSVTEDPNGLNLVTSYGYDPLDNLSTVTQGSQTRTFTHDSLGRLTYTTQPESGTTGYEYDNNGNMTVRTDSRGVRAAYDYDELNRLKSKTYSSDPSATSAVTYTYDDAAVAYGKGHLTKVENANATTSYLNYDALGRVVQSSQATAGQAYSFSYGYDLMGSLTSETYPSGRVITTQYDAMERASSVAGALASLEKNYATQISYAPHGGIRALPMGNNVWQVYSYNSRMQVERIEDAVNNDPSQVLFDQHFEWGTSDNNGNLQSVVTNHGGPGYPQPVTFKEYYGYDQLNRVSGSFGKDVNENLLWGQNFEYDRYGNAWTLPNAAGLPVSGLTPTTNVFNIANRMNATTYDAAGNQTVVGAYALVYDAENRQKQSTDSTTGAIVGYQYDGEGRRVEKALGSNDTVYVYDAFGQLAAEYTNGSAGTPPCQTCYLSTDHLGNTRLVTDGSANVIARHDFTPFGEEIPAGYAARTTQWGAFDGVRQKFTGQEHDEENQFDFFQARYLSSAQQRFLSPDASGLDQDPSNPQSWNLYSYVHNNPMNATDPTGNETCEDGTDADACVPGGSPDPVPIDPCWSCGYIPRNPGGGSSEPPTQPPPIVEIGREFLNWLGQPRDPGCMTANTMAGAGTGMAAGATFGAFFGPADVLTVPMAAASGYVGGAAFGRIGGLITCMSSSGRGGGRNNGQTGEAQRFDPRNSEHRSMTGDQIISKFKKGSIRSVFPGEMLTKPFDTIEALAKEGNPVAQTARKLLTDSRFNK